MKRAINILFLAFLILLSVNSVFADIVEGGISKNGAYNQIVDYQTNAPVQNAKITVPQKNFTTYTDSNGIFNLDTSINSSTLLSVEKQGYRPYSATINERIASHPIIIGIEKSNMQDIVLSTDMIHLGDNSFSDASANSKEFRGQANGAFYSHKFNMDISSDRKKNYLVIGSIIGIDTLMAKNMNQNSITSSYSSPPEIYFNGQKIAEIQINGDGQKVRLPNNLIKSGQNEITIKTGKNLQRKEYIDYDDIEFMNLSVISE